MAVVGEGADDTGEGIRTRCGAAVHGCCVACAHLLDLPARQPRLPRHRGVAAGCGRVAAQPDWLFCRGRPGQLAHRSADAVVRLRQPRVGRRLPVGRRRRATRGWLVGRDLLVRPGLRVARGRVDQ